MRVIPLGPDVLATHLEYWLFTVLNVLMLGVVWLGTESTTATGVTGTVLFLVWGYFGTRQAGAGDHIL